MSKDKKHHPPMWNPIDTHLQYGQNMSRDPLNAGAMGSADVQVTTMHSLWFLKVCHVCENRFRAGDRVRVCPKCGRARHDDARYGLHCWQAHFGAGHICDEGQTDPRFTLEEPCHYKPLTLSDKDTATTLDVEISQAMYDSFMEGLQGNWQPFGDIEVIKAQKGDAFIGQKCLICGNRVRVGDWVAACPCGKCNNYYHQDIFRHLECWDIWNKGRQGHVLDTCPCGHAYPTATDESGEHHDE